MDICLDFFVSLLTDLWFIKAYKRGGEIIIAFFNDNLIFNYLLMW